MNNEEVPQPTKKSKKPIVVTVLIVLLFVVTSVGIYLFQEKEVKDLRSQISDLKSNQNSEDKTDDQPVEAPNGEKLTYSPETGGLTFTYDKKYVVIENVDGNKGGAPGSTFKVGTRKSANVVIDHVYYGAQIDIDNSASELNTEVELVKERIRELVDNDDDITVTDTVVAGLPAKKLQADGWGYNGNINIFIVRSGDFMYTVRMHGAGDETQLAMEKDIIEGLTINAVTLP